MFIKGKFPPVHTISKHRVMHRDHQCFVLILFDLTFQLNKKFLAVFNIVAIVIDFRTFIPIL